MNLTIMSGRIATDLNPITTQNGKQMLGFNLAVQRDFKNAQGEYDTEFFRCIIFGQAIDFFMNYASKGYFVTLSGRMQKSEFKKDDGTKVESAELIVSNIDAPALFMNKNENKGQQSYQQNANNVPQQQGYNNQQNYNQKPQQSQQQRGQAQPNYNQGQQQNGQPQQQNPFGNANGPIDIEDGDLPF